MKIFLTILFSACLLSGFAQGKVDPAGKIVPTGPHAIASSKDLEGNIYWVQSIAERNAIPMNRRTVGFIVYVLDSTKHYTLSTSIANTHWVEFKTGTKWLTGIGAPSSGIGATDDYYVNTTNKDVYRKIGSLTWQYEFTMGGGGGGSGGDAGDIVPWD